MKKRSGIGSLPHLRKISIALILLALSISVYAHVRAANSFHDYLIEDAKEEAIKVATHLSSYDFFKNSQLDDPESIPEEWIKEVALFKSDQSVEKVKIYSSTGKVIFSTDSKDLGKINTHDYFYNAVAKGDVYSKVVEKGGKSREGQTYETAVVEIYVPIIRNGTFQGSFEIYYDITDEVQAVADLNDDLTSYLYIMGAIAIFLILVVVTLTKNKSVELGNKSGASSR